MTLPLPRKGVDIRTSDTSLLSGTVRSAVNVDIATSGEFARRRGFTLAVPSANMLALNSSTLGVVVHRQGELLLVDERTDTLTKICDFAGPDPADFFEYNDYLYVTNGTSFVKIKLKDRSWSPVATPLPARLPSLLAGPGSLDAGKYGVVMTVLDMHGEESAAAWLGTIECSGGIRVVDLVPDGRVHRFYITHKDGDIAYLAVEMAVFLPEVRLTEQPDGAKAPPLGRAPLPAGDFVCGHAGRLYTAANGMVRYSDPFNQHLTQQGHDFIAFVGDITMLEATSQGLYVGDDRGVWFLEGRDPTQFRPRLSSSDVAGFGSAQIVPGAFLPDDIGHGGEACPVWMTHSGYVVGTPSGVCKSVISDRIALDSGISGRTAVIQHRGNKQLVTMTGAQWGAIGSTTNSFNPAF